MSDTTDTPITDEAWRQPYTRQDQRLHAMRRTCCDLERQLAEATHQIEKYAAEAKSAIDENERLFSQLTEAREQRFTVDQIEEYFTGWLFTPVDPAAQAAIANGLSQLRCDEDGIAPNVKHAWNHIKELRGQRDRLAEAIERMLPHIPDMEPTGAAKYAESNLAAWGLRQALATLERKEAK